MQAETPEYLAAFQLLLDSGNKLKLGKDSLSFEPHCLFNMETDTKKTLRKLIFLFGFWTTKGHFKT